MAVLGVLTPALWEISFSGGLTAILLLDGNDSGGSSLLCLFRQASLGTALAIGLITGPSACLLKPGPVVVAVAKATGASPPNFPPLAPAGNLVRS